MPIGEVHLPDRTITVADLRSRYDDLIKEAVLRGRPDLEVVRADDVSAPGGITTDIFTRLMHSDYVIADVTFPSPNVFYELGIRHACRPGTILIREKGAPQAPFDIAALRYVEYENTPSGLKRLATELEHRFAWADLHPGEPDNDFLALAKLTEYQFQSFERKNEQEAAVFQAMMQVMQVPEILEMFLAQTGGKPIDQQELIKLVAQKPEALRAVLYAVIKTGQLKF